LALEKAKDASSKEKNLIRFQEHAGLANSHNMDIAFLVRVKIIDGKYLIDIIVYLKKKKY
jgi:hypothetical protein